MGPGQRARLNSPISARKRVEMDTKASNGGAEKKRASPNDRIAELEREVATLRERIARADGSLFDMKRDTAKDIARLMIEQGGESKFKTICGEGRAYLKAKAKPAPAG